MDIKQILALLDELGQLESWIENAEAGIGGSKSAQLMDKLCFQWENQWERVSAIVSSLASVAVDLHLDPTPFGNFNQVMLAPEGVKIAGQYCPGSLKELAGPIQQIRKKCAAMPLVPPPAMQVTLKRAAGDAKEVTPNTENLEHDGAEPIPPDQEKLNMFRKHGSTWEIHFGQEIDFPANRKGLEYIRRLLQTPGRNIKALDLMCTNVADTKRSKAIVEASKEGITQSSRDDGGTVQDPEAIKAAINAAIASDPEIQRLNDDIDETINPEKLQELKEHRDAKVILITKKLSRKGNRSMQKTHADKAANAVRGAINRAIDMLSENMPKLAEHLRQYIETGRECLYKEQYSWVTS